MKLAASKKTDDQRIALLFTAFFCYNLITLLINTIVNFFAPNTPIDTIICTAVYAYFIVLALGPIAHRITTGDIVFVFCCVLVYFSHCIFYPDNTDLLLKFAPTFLFTVFPLYFLGRSVRDYKVLLDYLEKSSHYIILVAFAYYLILIVSGQALREDNMSFAYFFLPFAIISFYSVMNNFSLIALSRTVLAVIALAFTGTRGPFMCLAAGIILLVFFQQKSTAKKIFLMFLLAGIAFFLFSDTFIRLMEELNRFLLSYDIRNRIITKLLNANLLDDSGRDSIKQILQSAIGENPILGYGILGDRVLLDTYAHSIIYELMIDFGVVIGVCIFGFLTVKVLINILSGFSQAYKTVSIIVISSVFIKLFVSGSYLQEPGFFLLLGVLFANQEAKGVKNNAQRIG